MKDAELRDDPPATEPFALPLHEEARSSRGPTPATRPTPAGACEDPRGGGRRSLVGEVYLPSAKWQPYLEHLDVAFAFELLHRRGMPTTCAGHVAATTARPGAAWVLSNHDFGGS